MSEQNSTGWPFGQAAGEGLDISAIFGTGTADPNRNPFDPTGAASAPAASVTPPPAAPVTPSPAAPVTPPPAAPVMPPPAAPVTQPPAAPVTQPPAAPVAQSPAAPIAPPPAAPVTQSPVEAEQPANPIEAAFAKQEMANAQQNLLEKKPIFCHKGAKEPIEDPTITFEELRICKAEDFVDLEEGKTVSWSMEYGGIRKEVKDPKGTTIAAMKQSIERSREFLEALKKSKDKNPDCLVRPKVIMKTMTALPLALIVPAEGLPADDRTAQGAVWSTVASLLQSGLGRKFSKFYPQLRLEQQGGYAPFGVVLGRAAPPLFRELYRKALDRQAGAIMHHTLNTLSRLNPDQFFEEDGTIVCPAVIDGSDPDLMFHGLWHLAMQQGEILPDCGVYHVAQKRASIEPKEVQQTLAHPERYALCMVCLEPPEVPCDDEI